ncbi:MAG: NUDIX domain-containing protein [Proteobacteria bacterium]|nr:NUDIX domain-containing protein [Pseudomonadota bacterium]
MPSRLILSAGCFAFRHHRKKLQLLLVQSASDDRLWTLPGGGVREGESLQKAAKRELWEEAGLKGKFIAKHLPIYAERKRDKLRFCYTYFLFEVKSLADTWPESEKRDRMWVAVDTLIAKKPSTTKQTILKNIWGDFVNHKAKGKMTAQVKQQLKAKLKDKWKDKLTTKTALLVVALAQHPSFAVLSTEHTWQG